MPLLACKYMAMMHHCTGAYAPGNPHTMNLNLDCELAMSTLLDDAIVGGRVLVVICVAACRGRDYHLVNTCKQSNTPLSHPNPLANPHPSVYL